MSKELIEAVAEIAEFAESSRKEYGSTKEWTANKGHSCMTIRVPVALLNRIREAAIYAADLAKADA
jgi:hypothetical protein